MKRIKTGITIRTEEVMIIRASRRTSRTLCRQCPEQPMMLTTEEAMLLAGTSARAIYRWIEAGSVHYLEMAEGSVLVCPDSILKLAIRAE